MFSTTRDIFSYWLIFISYVFNHPRYLLVLVDFVLSISRCKIMEFISYTVNYSYILKFFSNAFLTLQIRLNYSLNVFYCISFINFARYNNLQI